MVEHLTKISQIYVGCLPRSGTMSDRWQGQESIFKNMNNASILFATVSWKQTILWGGCASSV